MSIWSLLFSQSRCSDITPEVTGPSGNPKTGLPMSGDTSVDVAGNQVGCGSPMSDTPSSIGSDTFYSFSRGGFRYGSD